MSHGGRVPQARPLSANADDVAVGRNAVTGYAAWFVNLAIGLVLTPILLRGLGTDGFGAWTFAFTLATYVGVVELGLGVATIRHLASALARGDQARATVVAASARFTYLAMALAGTVVLAVLVLAPGLIFRAEGASTASVRMTVLLVGGGFVLSSAASVYPAIAVGAGRSDLGTIVGMVARVAMAAAQAAVVLTTGSLVGLGLVTAVGVVGGTLAVRAVTRRHFSDIDVSLGNAERGMIRTLLSSGWRNGAIAVTAAVAVQSDVIVVGAILGPAEVAAYGIATRAFMMVLVLSSKATDVLVPTFAHSAEVADVERIRTAFRESVFLARSILVPALIILAVFGGSLLKLWLRDVPAGAVTVLVVLVLGAVAAAPGHSSFAFLTGIERLNFLLVGSTVAAIGNVIASVALTWQIGVVGPAVGSLIAFSIWNLLLLPRHVGSQISVPWGHLSAAGLQVLALPSLVAFMAALGYAEVVGRTSPREGVPGSILTGAVFLVILAVTLPRNRRERYRRLAVGAFRPR